MLGDTVPEALRRAVTGSPQTPLVFLGNFEVEDRWAVDEPGLPRLGGGSGRAVVNRMDEFALLLGGEGDHVVVKSAPDEDYMAYLTELGLHLPHIVAVTGQQPDRLVTEDALADPATLTRLRELGQGGARLLPHGVSDLEQRLAKEARLPLATPSAEVCKSVNSKIYSRTIAAQAALRQAEGFSCTDLATFAIACEQARKWLSEGRTVGLKDAYGVSGKGMLVVREERMLDQAIRMIERRAQRSGDDRLSLVVEEWVAKETDLNYQFTVDRQGGVTFNFVKEALTAGGVHQGHRMPAVLNGEQQAAIIEAAQLLGARLAADGYFGVVGVDAMTDPDGGVYPVVEINARNNMSTYQERLRAELIAPDSTALATMYPLKLVSPMPFREIRRLLDGLLFTRAGGTGLIVNNTATVNAAAGGTDGRGFDGRLYAIVVGANAAHVEDLDRRARARLAEIRA